MFLSDSNEKIRSLAGKARTLDERISASKPPPALSFDCHQLAVSRVDNWRRLAADGDATIFAARLKAEGLTESQAHSLIVDDQLNVDQDMPHWTTTFSWAAKAFCTAAAPISPTPFLNADTPLPFEELLAPVVMASRTQRDRLVNSSTGLLQPKALAALDGMLLKRLSDLLAPTLCELFFLYRQRAPFTLGFLSQNTSACKTKTRYNAFIAEFRERGIESYFDNRPILARLLATTIDQWIEVTAEFIERLTHDASAICETFGELSPEFSVTDIIATAGDRHNDGRFVLGIKLFSGRALAYKPRSLELERAWQLFITWLDAHSAPPSTRAAVVLTRPGYGWMEWIEPEPKVDGVDASSFFQRAGCLLCLFYLLQGTDFHLENVIAQGSVPIVVDLETLLEPLDLPASVVPEPLQATYAADVLLVDSVLRSGYLPYSVVGVKGRRFGLGGLSPVEGAAVPKWSFTDVNTDSMRMELVDVLPLTTSHLPVVGGIQLSVRDHCNAFVLGFEAMYRFIYQNRCAMLAPEGPLSFFHQKQVRVVLQSTQLYSLILQSALDVTRFSNGAVWSTQFELLARLTDWIDVNESAVSIQRAERYCLASLDIPYFFTYTNSNDLFTSRGPVTRDFFKTPSLEDVHLRIYAMNEEKLGFQTRLIRDACCAENDGLILEHHSLPWEGASVDDTLGQALMREDGLRWATQIAERIEKAALRKGRSVAWIGVVPSQISGEGQLSVIGNDLYSGTTGIAVFFASLFHATGESKYKSLAMQTLESFQVQLRDSSLSTHMRRRMGIGGGAGLGSAIYALTLVGSFLSDYDLILADIHLLTKLISAGEIGRDSQFDVMGGVAGAILGLLTATRTNNQDLIISTAVLCGEHLLKEASIAGARSQRFGNFRSRPLTGFAHGAAGKALALFRLFRVTGDQRFKACALGHLAYERSVFRELEGYWPDFRPLAQSYIPCQWCHGASGIGQSRLDMTGLGTAEELNSEIDAALLRTLETPIEPIDHLCCGNLGRLDFVLTAGEYRNDERLVKYAQHRACQLFDLIKSSRGFKWRLGCDFHNPGLFTGLAGVGYEALRLSEPSEFPSVLLWETNGIPDRHSKRKDVVLLNLM